MNMHFPQLVSPRPTFLATPNLSASHRLLLIDSCLFLFFLFLGFSALRGDSLLHCPPGCPKKITEDLVVIHEKVIHLQKLLENMLAYV